MPRQCPGAIQSAREEILPLLDFENTGPQRRANISSAYLADFVTVFCDFDFISSNDWEGEVMPVDAGGIMIIDPVVVVAQLKALPWRHAKAFIGERNVVDAFEDYEANGTGLAALKIKFAANRTITELKWAELRDWVAQQKSPNP